MQNQNFRRLHATVQRTITNYVRVPTAETKVVEFREELGGKVLKEGGGYYIQEEYTPAPRNISYAIQAVRKIIRTGDKSLLVERILMENGSEIKLIATKRKIYVSKAYGGSRDNRRVAYKISKGLINDEDFTPEMALNNAERGIFETLIYGGKTIVGEYDRRKNERNRGLASYFKRQAEMLEKEKAAKEVSVDKATLDQVKARYDTGEPEASNEAKDFSISPEMLRKGLEKIVATEKKTEQTIPEGRKERVLQALKSIESLNIDPAIKKAYIKQIAEAA